MQRVDYEGVAASYDRRYASNDFDDIARCLSAFLANGQSIVELGCGTGHWLARAGSVQQHPFVVGLDRSSAMLAHARHAAPDAALVRGTADSLPWSSAAFDRAFCVNALHHFGDPLAVYRECTRVLRRSGSFMTIGLDPHTNRDEWWIYDYFPTALEADRRRYPSTETIRSDLASVGFVRVETTVAQRISAVLAFEDAEAQGFLDRRSTSQLLLISDEQWAAGLEQLRRERPTLRADLRLYATVGCIAEVQAP
jgi:SAM-dependent methyltransferase